MTIPVAPVNINPQFVPNQQAPGMELLLRALEQRQELDLRKKKLQQEQEQFELNRRLIGSQIEGSDLLNAKRKKELKDAEDDLAAQDLAYQTFVGNLTRVNDMKGWGAVIAGVKDEAVGGHLMSYIKDHFTTQALATNWERQETPQGIVQVNPETGEVRPLGIQGPPDAGLRRIPVVTEREKASYAVGAMHGNAIVNRLEQQYPDIAARVARKVALRKGVFTGIMHRLTGTSREDADLLTEQTIEQSMSPEELEFYQAAKQYLANVIPAIAGKQMTAREYAIQAPSFFSMGAVTPTVTRNRRRARASRIRGFITESGEAFTERLPEIGELDLSEYGLGPTPPRHRRPENPY